MPVVPGPLALLEGFLDGPDQSDVLLDDDAEGQDVLLCLAVVEVADAEVEVGEGGERAGQGGRELDLGEGV